MTEVFEDSNEIPLKSAHPLPAVLIIADDALLRKRFEDLLAAAAWRARAVTGADALAMLASDDPAEEPRPRIVMVDGQLPDHERVDRALRNETDTTPIYRIWLVGPDAEITMTVGSEGAPDDYLDRRANAVELSARLRTAQRILALEQSRRDLAVQQVRLITIDALTGANNRAYFIRHLYRDLEQARRFGGMVSVLVLDVDHFKRINDRYGHAAGDEVLQELSRRVGASLRDCDWYARVGDEEFAVVLPQTPLPGARILAERIRRQVSAAPVPTRAGAVAVSVSIGVSGLESFGPSEAATVERLFGLACRCVHQSKVRGRDCVTVPEDLTARGAARK